MPLRFLDPCIINKIDEDDCIGISYVPSGHPDVEAIMSLFPTVLPQIKTRGFADEDALLSKFKDAKEGTMWGALIFPDAVIGQSLPLDPLDYTIRVNQTLLYGKLLFADSDVKPRPLTLATSGYLMIQQALYAAIGILHAPAVNGTTGPPLLMSQYEVFPSPADKVILPIDLASIWPLIFEFNLLVQVLLLGYRVSLEATNGTHDLLLVMGLEDMSYWCAWALSEFIWAALASVVMVIGCLLGGLVEYVGIFPLLPVLVLFSAATVTQTLLIGSISNSPKSGSALAGAYLLFEILVGLLSQWLFLDESFNLAFFSHLLTPLVPQIPFGAAVLYIAQQEMDETSVKSSDVWSEPHPHYSFGVALIWLAIDTVLYFALIPYFRLVLTQRQPWYFLFTKQFWMHRSPATNEDAVEMKNVGEEGESADTTSGIAIEHLRKVFAAKDKGGEDVIAVDDLSLSIPRGSVLALLGPNGAGKSTTINALCGLVRITSGSVKILGKQVQEFGHSESQILGVCGQDNILWENMTAREHLRLFISIKGMPAETAEAEIDSCLSDVLLTEKANVCAKFYSGGQRRKLCLALALLGGPPVQLLDEPTAGMDPASRRKVWKILEERKKSAHATVLLTTHSVEEAEALGDHLALMNKGKLHEYGTAAELKAKHHIGHHLHLTLSSTEHHASVEAFVLQHFPDAVPVDRDDGTPPEESIYSLVQQQDRVFGPFFADLEDKMEELGVVDCAMGGATLEQLFLRFQAEKAKSVSTTDLPVAISSSPPQGNLPRARRGNWGQQFSAVFYRRMLSLWHSKGFFIWTLVMPLIFMTMGPPVQAIVNLVLVPELDLPPVRLDSVLPESLLAPCGVPWSNMTAMGHGYSASDLLNGTLYALGGPSADCSSPWAPIPGGVDQLRGQLLASMRDKPLSAPAKASAIASDDGATVALVLGGWNTTSRQASVTVFYNNSDSLPYMALPAFTAALGDAFLSMSGVGVSLRQSMHPLPSLVELDPPKIMAFVVPLFWSISFSFMIPIFAMEIVSERASLRRFLSLTHGLRLTPYWCANFAIDLSRMIIAIIVCWIIYAAVSFEAFVETPLFIWIWLFGIFSLVMLPFSYLASLPFKAEDAAAKWLFPLAIIGMILAWLIVSLGPALAPNDEDAEAQGLFVERLLSFYPPMAFHNIVKAMFLAVEQDGEPFTSIADIFSSTAGIGMVALLIELPLFIVLVLFVDWQRTQRRDWPFFPCFKGAADHPESSLPTDRADHDARNERDRVSNISQAQDQESQLHEGSLVVMSVKKSFPIGGAGRRSGDDVKWAVREASLLVEPGECFGLLGPNGAGKTTLIGNVTGRSRPDCGDASLYGHSIVSQLNKVYGDFGICLQDDVAYGELSPREHLTFYARLRGFSSTERESIIPPLLKKVGLVAEADRPTRSLSGGKRRALSIAQALVGNPPILFADEPSASLDPITRQQLWDLIHASRLGRVLFLTTHSLHEADALCSRIGIMVDGQIRVLGSPQHLKSSYGTVYNLEVVHTGNESDAEAFVKASFPSAVFRSVTGDSVHWEVPRDVISMAKAFALLDKAVADRLISSFSLTQTSLEQVFMQLAREQEVIDAEAAEVKKPTRCGK